MIRLGDYAARVLVVACALATLASLAGCQTTQVADRRIGFSYSIGTLGSTSSIVADLSNHRTWVARVAGTTPGFWPPCKFTTPTGDGPDFRIFGMIRQPGSSLRIDDFSPTNSVTSNPATCAQPSAIDVTIGGPSSGVSSGHPINSGSATFVIGNESFTTSNAGFFEAQFSAVNENTNYVSGTFNMLIHGTTPGTVLMIWGSFSGTS